MKSKGHKKNGRSAAAGRDSVARGSSPGTPTLDDLAARLLLAEPTDSSELEAFREELLEIARDGAVHEEVRTLAAEALLRLDEILYGTSPGDGEGILAEVGAILDRAIRAGQAPARKDSPQRPAAEDPSDDRGCEAVFTDGGTTGDTPFLRLPSDMDADLMGDFLAESLELIEAAEAALLALEVDPDDMEAVNTVFRAFHTIKGTSGFLGLSSIKELAHRAESILSRIRDGEIRHADGYADLALRSIDLLKDLVASVEGALAGRAPAKPAAYDQLLAQLSDSEAAVASEYSPARVRPRRYRGVQPHLSARLFNG